MGRRLSYKNLGYETEYFDKILRNLNSTDRKNQKEPHNVGKLFSLGKEIILSTGEKEDSEYIVVFPEKLSFKEEKFFYWETPWVTIDYRHLLVTLSTCGISLVPQENVIPELVFSSSIFINVKGDLTFRSGDDGRFVISQETLHVEKGHWTRQHLWEKSGEDYSLTIDEANELEIILFDFKKLLPKIKAYNEQSFQIMEKENSKRIRKEKREQKRIHSVR